MLTQAHKELAQEVLAQRAADLRAARTMLRSTFGKAHPRVGEVDQQLELTEGALREIAQSPTKQVLS
jgi:hypothetical protein